MKLNGFMMGPEIKKLFKIKVDTPTAGHPVRVSVTTPSTLGIRVAFEWLLCSARFSHWASLAVASDGNGMETI